MSQPQTKLDKPDIYRLLELQRTLLVFQSVQRRVHIPPGTQDFENDVEHSYALAVLGWFLAPYFPELDADRIIRLGLAHDLVEVHAGDTFSYAPDAALSNKAEREHLAYQRLCADWQDFPEMLVAIKEYEAKSTPEAKFVYALDKLQPAMIDYLNEGRGWRELGITATMFRQEKDKKVPISPEINDYMDQLHRLLAGQQDLFAKDVII